MTNKKPLKVNTATKSNGSPAAAIQNAFMLSQIYNFVETEIKINESNFIDYLNNLNCGKFWLVSAEKTRLAVIEYFVSDVSFGKLFQKEKYRNLVYQKLKELIRNRYENYKNCKVENGKVIFDKDKVVFQLSQEDFNGKIGSIIFENEREKQEFIYFVKQSLRHDLNRLQAIEAAEKIIKQNDDIFLDPASPIIFTPELVAALQKEDPTNVARHAGLAALEQKKPVSGSKSAFKKFTKFLRRFLNGRDKNKTGLV